MDSIQQIVTSNPQLASSATSVAGALAKPRTSSTNSTSSTSSTAASTSANSSTITANDFLTLLVAEMQNQDPTQPTDPNTYITQMVDVNSLQQLIGINSGISSLDTASGVAPSASGSMVTGGTPATPNVQAVATADAMPSLFSTTSSGASGSDVGASSGSGAGSGSIGTPLWSSGVST